MRPHVSSSARTARFALLVLSLAALVTQSAAGLPQTVSATYFGGLGHERLVAAAADAAGDVYVFGSTTDFESLPLVTHVVPPQPNLDTTNCFVARIGGGVLRDVILFQSFSECDAFELAPDGVVNVAMRSQAGNFGGATQLRTITFNPDFGVTIGPLRGTDVVLPGGTRAVDIRSNASATTYVLFHAVPIPGPVLNGLLKVSAGTSSVSPLPFPLAAQPSASAIAIGDSGVVFVVGTTEGAITTTPDAYQPNPVADAGCSKNGVLFGLNTIVSPATVTYASYLSGANCDSVDGIVRDAAGHLFLVGTTTSDDLPFGGVPPSGGQETLFVTAFDLNRIPAEQLLASRFLGVQPAGAPSYDPIVLLDGGRIGISGGALTPTFPLVDPLFDASPAPTARFFQVLASTLDVLLSTHLDASGAASASAVTSSGNRFIAVTTTPETGLATAGQPQETHGGGEDLLVRTIEIAQPSPANDPPIVTVTDPGPVMATSPGGRQLWLMATALDPEGNTLDIMWTIPGDDVQYQVASYPGNASIFIQAPIGTSHIVLRVDDRAGNVVTRTLDLVVAGVNTPADGTPVDLEIADDTFRDSFEFTPGRLKVTFPEVTSGGLTWFRTRQDQTPPPPAGKQLGSAPFYYDLATTAGVSGDVRVCANATGMSFVNASQVRLHRLDGGAWYDISVAATAPEAAARWVCGISTSQLGTFALLTPADESTRVTTVIGTGAPYAVGIPAPGDGGPANLAPIGVPQTLVFDTPRGVAYVGDTYRIRKIDLATNIITTIAGTGDFPGEVRYGEDARLSALAITRLAVDHAGNLFTGDSNGCGIIRIDSATNLLTRVAGVGPDPVTLQCGFSEGDGGPAAAARINGAGSLILDAAGNLFFQQVTPNGDTVRKITPGSDGLITGSPDEIITTVAGGGSQWPPTGGDPLAALLNVNDLAFGAHGDLYIASGPFVLRLTPAQQLSVVAGKFALDYDALFAGDNGPALDANMVVWSLEVVPNGDLLISDFFAFKIRRIIAGLDGVVTGTPDEIITTVAGFVEGGPLLGQFNGDGYALSTYFLQPRDVVLDPRGGVNILDTGFNRIRHVNFEWAQNAAPVADTGPNIEIETTGTSALVQLDGTASSDPDGHPLTFTWTDGVRAAFGATPQLLLPRGTYSFSLIVRDPAGATSVDTVNVTVREVTGPSADVGVTVTPMADPVLGGSDFVVTPALLNLGPDSAFVGRLSFQVPAGLTLVTAPAVCSTLGDLVTCDVEPLASGASVPLSLTFRGAQLGTYTLTFTASTPLHDPNLSNNVVSLTVIVDLTVREQIGVADTVLPQPAVMLNVVEQVTVTDAASPQTAVMINVIEPVTVTDTAAPQPAVMINVIEPVTVADTAAPQPAVMINVIEPVTVADTAAPQPAVMINVIEPVTVADTAAPQPAVMINVIEPVTVADTTAPQPAVVINVIEHVDVADAVSPQAVVRIDVVEQVMVADTATVEPETPPNVDTTPPAIALTSPANGATFLLNEIVAAAYVCTDTESGVATCEGTLPSGAPINTAAVGAASFTVNASDLAGNAASAVATYQISYRICAVTDLSKPVKTGGTIAITTRLCDVNAADYSSAGTTITVQGVQRLTTGESMPITTPAGRGFLFDPQADAYTFVLKTSGYQSGTYRLLFRAGADPAVHALEFRVK